MSATNTTASGPGPAGSSSIRRGALGLWIHAGVAVACDAAYLAIIVAQGNLASEVALVGFVFAYVAGLAAASLLAIRARPPRARAGLLAWAAAGSFGAGLVGAFSLVMVPLIPAAIPLVAAIGRVRPRRTLTVVTAAALALAVLIGGLELGWR